MDAPQFYGLYSLMILLGAGIILLPDIPLIAIMYYSQVINGILLPVILVAMLLLVNDRTIMGEHVNGPLMNVISWAAVAGLIVLSAGLLLSSIFS